MIDKAQSREIRQQIRRVLLGSWDPIGIKDEPNAQDEYDGYIGRLYELLVSDSPDAEIVEYLYWSAYQNMGLETTREHMIPTLQELRKISFAPAERSSVRE
jgi:hypothetical protein